MVDGAVLLSLEIDVVLIVTMRIYEVSVNLLSGGLLLQNLQAPMIQRHFNNVCTNSVVMCVA